MPKFNPHLEILPAPQRTAWPELRQVPKHFVLYGGTALALRLAHRHSVDFDFFTSESFVPGDLLRALPLLSGAKILQNVRQTLTVSINRGAEIRLSFFGQISLGRVGEPEETADGVLVTASLLDLAGTKAAVITQRAESKDYIDLLALVQNGVSLSQAMAAARSIYGEQYNPILTLKSLTYFGDGDLYKLSTDQQARLVQLAAGVEPTLPAVPRIANTLSR